MTLPSFHNSHVGITLHYREADQSSSYEHVVIEPVGDNLRDRMAQWRRCGKIKHRRSAASCSGTSAGAHDPEMLIHPAFHFLSKRSMRGPLGIPQTRGR